MGILELTFYESYHWVFELTWYLIVFLDAYQDSQLEIPKKTHKVGFLMRVLYTFMVGYQIFGGDWLLSFWMLKQGAIFYIIFNPTYNAFRFYKRYKEFGSVYYKTWFRPEILFYLGDTATWDVRFREFAKKVKLKYQTLWVIIALLSIIITHFLYYWAIWNWG